MYGDALQQWQTQLNSSRPNSWQSFQGINATNRGMDRSTIRLPGVVPPNLLSLMLKSPEISSDDIDILRTKIFTDDLIAGAVFDSSIFSVTFKGMPNISYVDTFER